MPTDGRTLLRERDVWITTERVVLRDEDWPTADLDRIETFATPGTRGLDAALAAIALAIVLGCGAIGGTMGFERGGMLLMGAVGVVGSTSLLAALFLARRAWGNGPRHGLLLVFAGTIERDIHYSSPDRAWVGRVKQALERARGRSAPT